MTESISLDAAIAWLSTQTVPVRTTSPDLLGQLRMACEKPVTRIVCIGIDPDPEIDLLADVRRARGADIDAGLKLLREWFGVAPIRIDAHSPATAYPNLLPAMLVRRLSRKRLMVGELPTVAGVLIVDVITAAQILSPLPLRERARVRDAAVPGGAWTVAVEKTLPPTPLADFEQGEVGKELPVIVDDHILQRRYRATVNANATTADVLTLGGIATCDIVLRHGPLLAEMPVTLTTPISQTDLWLHVLPPTLAASAACTRCGECVTACPVHIHPAALLEAAQRGSATMAQQFHAEACIECGLCTAVCPSSLPVRAGVVAAKMLMQGRIA